MPASLLSYPRVRKQRGCAPRPNDLPHVFVITNHSWIVAMCGRGTYPRFVSSLLLFSHRLADLCDIASAFSRRCIPEHHVIKKVRMRHPSNRSSFRLLRKCHLRTGARGHTLPEWTYARLMSAGHVVS